MEANRNLGIRFLVVVGALLGSCGGPEGDGTLEYVNQALGGPTVSSVTLSPSTIAGGSGGTSTGTVTLTGPAPTGGTLVSIGSSNTSLAGSVPTVTVAA